MQVVSHNSKIVFVCNLNNKDNLTTVSVLIWNVSFIVWIGNSTVLPTAYVKWLTTNYSPVLNILLGNNALAWME